MAQRRMISCSLGSSRKFHALGRTPKIGEFSQALYMLLIPSSDDFGRLAGDGFTVKHSIWPTSPRSEDDFAAALEAMDRVGLIHLYVSDDKTIIQINDFETHQTGLHKRTKSKYPEPSSGNSRKLPEVPGNSNAIEENRTEQKRREYPPIGPPKGTKPKKSGCPDSFPITAQLKAWADEHCPNLNLETETEAWLDHHRSHGNRFIDWNAAWRKWMRNAVEWGQARVHSGGDYSIAEQLWGKGAK